MFIYELARIAEYIGLSKGRRQMRGADPYPAFDYLRLGQLGDLLGVSATAVGTDEVEKMIGPFEARPSDLDGVRRMILDRRDTIRCVGIVSRVTAIGGKRWDKVK